MNLFISFFLHSVSHAVGIALIIDIFRIAETGKDIVDLAHGDGIQSRCLDGIQHGLGGRFQGIVMPVGSPLEAVDAVAHKGTGNDTANTVLAPENISGLVAGIVEFFQRNVLFVGRSESPVCSSRDTASSPQVLHKLI